MLTGLNASEVMLPLGHHASILPQLSMAGALTKYFTKCQDTHQFSEEAKKAYGSPQKGWNALKRDIQDKKVAFAITDIDPVLNCELII